MADARRPKKADYKIQGQAGKPNVDPRKRKSAKGNRNAQVEAVKAHQIPITATINDLVGALNERGASGLFKTTELCSELVTEFGGLKGFAKEYKAIYDQTESNHLKARMFESMVKLIAGVNKMMGDEDPVDTLTDEDLGREAKAMFEKFYGAATNGSPGANDGRGIPAVPQADGGVGQAAVGGPKLIPPPPEDGGVP